jgi:hypothetical protein
VCITPKLSSRGCHAAIFLPRSEKQATQVMRAQQWVLDAATDYWYEHGMVPDATTAAGAASVSAIEAEFRKYEGECVPARTRSGVR